MKIIMLVIGVILLAVGLSDVLANIGLPDVIINFISIVPTFGLKPIFFTIAGVILVYLGIRK